MNADKFKHSILKRLRFSVVFLFGVNRRSSAVNCFALLFLTSAATQGLAQPAVYPAKSVRMIVPAPANTPIDYAARILGRALGEEWDHPVLVDNRAAGNGVAGQELVANAQPDGHTLLVQSIAFVTHPLLYKLPYDTERDFIPVARIAASGLALVVHALVTASSVRELLALARQRPGALGYASDGTGSAAHLAGDMLRSLTAANLAHAAQRSVPEALGEVMSGRAQMMFLEIAYARPHVEGGALRALATSGRARSRIMPGLPTLAESGVKGYQFELWLGAFVPSGTPATIVDRIAAELARVLDTPGMDQRLLAQGYENAWQPATEFQRFVRGESQKFTTLIKKAGSTRQ
jgi:tripartite-type tricarboxylate transporter receptor subunit TctC